jgi:hypothetical protein
MHKRLKTAIGYRRPDQPARLARSRARRARLRHRPICLGRESRLPLLDPAGRCPGAPVSDCPDVRTSTRPPAPESGQPPYEGSHIVRQPVHTAPNRLIPQLSVARITSEAPRKRQAKPLSPARLKKMSKEELLKTGKRLGLKGLSPRMSRQSLLLRIGTNQEVVRS